MERAGIFERNPDDLPRDEGPEGEVTCPGPEGEVTCPDPTAQ